MAGRGSSPGEEGKGRGSGAGGCALLAVEEEVEGDAMGGELGAQCLLLNPLLVGAGSSYEEEGMRRRKKKKKGREEMEEKIIVENFL
jgi:hypothetical protein